MWVLESRKDAEKVWFPVVWEEEKDASNVIDYDIHDEITKDTSSVINANNDTTTGMANVIPWINAPKLIATTSIIWWTWWGWGWKTPQASIQIPIQYFNSWQNYHLTSWIRITNEWNAWFTEETWNVKVWKWWAYAWTLYVSSIFWSWAFTKTVRVYNNGVLIVSATSPYNWTNNISFTASLASWDILSFYCEASDNASAWFDWSLTLTLTKQ